jgi:hypothetical protein
MWTVQINPFRPGPSHSANESQPFQFDVNIFIRRAVAGVGRKFFSPGPKPAQLLTLPSFSK